jgi:hypothetical protein
VASTTKRAHCCRVSTSLPINGMHFWVQVTAPVDLAHMMADVDGGAITTCAGFQAKLELIVAVGAAHGWLRG